MTFSGSRRRIVFTLVAIVAIPVVWLATVNLLIETKDVQTTAPDGIAWTMVGPHRIAYQNTPNKGGRNVLLVGGTTAWSGTWEYTRRDLADTYNVYAIDLPPFGYSIVDPSYRYDLQSQAQLINDIIESLALRDVTLVAHSYGAGPSMEAVLREPEQYRELVIIDGAIHVDRETSGALAYVGTIFSIQTFRYAFTSALVHVPGFVGASIKYLVHDNSTVDEFWIDTYSQPLRNEDQSKRLAAWFYDFVFKNGTGLSSTGVNYASLRVPVSIMWGREDNLTPLSQGEYLHSLIPGSTLTVMDGVGHIPMIDDHAGYMEILRSYIAN
ncbi:MAG: alpha/beta hydrolase [Candidatus Pacebacteria bacterium]|nr:alpha/beta hydrolase [Candidatus Paceibacterota bacterium]